MKALRRLIFWFRGYDPKELEARAEECSRVVRHGARNAAQTSEAVIWAAQRRAQAASAETQAAEALLEKLSRDQSAEEHHS